MLRVGRFRHRLLDEEFLKYHGPQGAKSLAPFISQWQRGELTAVEIVAVYLLVFMFLRRPQDFLGGPHNLELPATPSQGVRSSDIIHTLRQTLPVDLQNAKSLKTLEQNHDFVSLLCSRSWRSIPFAVQKSLTSWSMGLYPLQLLTRVPEPLEVLNMQAAGQRCVSMLITLEEITGFVEEGRDVLGFLIHDLIHADHFFQDSLKAAAQVEFCKKLRVVHDLPFVQQRLHTEQMFRKEFHYLMADMNSVPLHLLKTLKAILLGTYKRQAGIPLGDPLPSSLELEFRESFEMFLQPWNFSPAALAAAHRLNTQVYKDPEDSLLLNYDLSIPGGGLSANVGSCPIKPTAPTI